MWLWVWDCGGGALGLCYGFASDKRVENSPDRFASDEREEESPKRKTRRNREMNKKKMKGREK